MLVGFSFRETCGGMGSAEEIKAEPKRSQIPAGHAGFC
jgi:hypothetical protein